MSVNAIDIDKKKKNRPENWHQSEGGVSTAVVGYYFL